MEDLFIQFSLVLGLATVAAIILRFLKQPLIIAYILTGLLISALGVTDVGSSETLRFLPEVGIALLLFLVGMELDLREIRNIGRQILAVAALQIAATFLIGFGLVSLLGFGPVGSLYLALGLSFSSTILVVKLLIEKEMLSSLSGKLAVGILLLEDLVAIFALMALSAFASGNHLPGIGEFLVIFAKGLGLFIITLVLSKRLLPIIFELVASSSELLFISTVSWVLLFVSFSLWVGFSPNIGAFLAGLALASSPYRFQMAGRLKLLRDLFIALFFINIGSGINMQVVPEVLGIILILVVFVLVWKPLLFLFLLGRSGFRRHTIYLTSIGLTQTSEFSLIIASIGLGLGHLTDLEVTVIAMVTIITMTISSYIFLSSGNLYKLISSWLLIFEKESASNKGQSPDEKILKDHIILAGCDSMGRMIVEALQKGEKAVVVLDFNPDVIKELQNQGFLALYGDMTDPEILESAQADTAGVIISTIPDRQDSIEMLKELANLKVKAPVIVTASHANEALELYEQGAAYVIMPRILGGKYVGQMILSNFDNWQNLDQLRQDHIAQLTKEHEQSRYIFDKA